MNMARPEGFEPPTPTFVALYSIQLSYGRAFSKLYHPILGGFLIPILDQKRRLCHSASHRSAWSLSGHSAIYEPRVGFVNH
jgi:hypothetical protein